MLRVAMHWLPLIFAIAVVAAPRPAPAVEDAQEEDGVFWSDPRGIILPIGEGELDLVRLGELREQYELGMAHLAAGRWDAAIEALEGVAGEIPVPEVLLAAAVAHFQLEQYTRAEELLGLALAAAPEDVRCNNLMGLVLSAQGRPTEAQPYLLICHDRAVEDANDAFVAYAMLNLAQIELDLGRPDQGAELAQGALDIGKRKRFGNVTAASFNTLGNVALYRGEMRAAEKYYRKSSGVERRGRGNEDRAAVLNNLANVLAARGELAGARDLLMEAVGAARETGRTTQEGGILVTLAGIEHQLGNHSAVDPMLESALELFRKLELDRGIAEVRLQQARVSRGRQRYREALEGVELGRLALEGLTLPRLVAELDLLEAELLLDTGDLAAAADRAAAARKWFASAQQPALEAGATLAWAEASARTEATDDAVAGFEHALTVLRACDDPARLADARQRYGLYLLSEGELERGRELVDASLEWMVEAGRDDLAAQTHNLAGAALVDAGALEDALDCFEAGQSAAVRSGDTGVEVLCRSNRIRVLAQLDRWDEALDAAGPEPTPEHLELVESGRARSAFHAGLEAMDREDWSAASMHMGQVLERAPGSEETLRVAAHANLRMIAHHQGREALQQGDYPTAAEHLIQALEHVGFEEDPLAEARVLEDMGMLKFELQDAQAAVGFLEQALAAAEAAGDEPLRRTVHFHLGLVCMETDEARALGELQTAIATRPGAADELAAACHYNLGILQYRGDQYADSRTSLEKALELYQALGAATQAQQIREYLDEFPDDVHEDVPEVERP
jgi:tetratricopeptide (TPR) repeat protein